MKKQYLKALAGIALTFGSISASAVPQCWILNPGGVSEEICFQITNYGFVRALTGVLWSPNNDMCFPVDGAMVKDPMHNVERMEFTRMIGSPIVTHADVHHTTTELDPATLNGIWNDQHGAGGSFVYVGFPSPGNHCL